MTANQQNIDCIIPAAGLSTRMGTWKLTLAYKDSTILEQTISNALSFCSRVILVVGHQEQELISHYKRYTNISIVRNEDYLSGMFSSIQVGINAVTSDFFFICHGDMPCIDTLIYQKLWDHRIHGAVFPGNESLSGHPVIIHTGTFKQQRNTEHFKSMKQILKKGDVHFLKLDDPFIHLDVDTQEAYDALLNLPTK